VSPALFSVLFITFCHEYRHYCTHNRHYTHVAVLMYTRLKSSWLCYEVKLDFMFSTDFHEQLLFWIFKMPTSCLMWFDNSQFYQYHELYETWTSYFLSVLLWVSSVNLPVCQIYGMGNKVEMAMHSMSIMQFLQILKTYSMKDVSNFYWMLLEGCLVPFSLVK
jgi:hypothetical protein